MKKKWLFGITNIRWGIKELIKIYSGSEKSFFSKKRIESGIAFVILQWGMISYFLHKWEIPMEWSDMLMWAGVEAAICGYALNKIEKTNQTKPE